MAEKHNGWANYETWLANLWLDNDGYGELIEEMAIQFKEENENEGAEFDLADWLKDFCQENLFPDLGASFAADLLNAAISEIDWQEIADHHLSDLD